MTVKPPKGTRDFSAGEMAIRKYVFEQIINVF